MLVNECLCKYKSVIQRLAFGDFMILTEKLRMMLILCLETLVIVSQSPGV